jgi:hypothetical protein
MQECVFESRVCGDCGALVSVASEGEAVRLEGRQRRSSLRGAVEGLLCGVPRERSVLAHAAGFAGVLYLFRYSFVPLSLSAWWPAWALGTGLVFLFTLLGPVALVLGFAAGVSLDRAPEKSGRLQALFGLFVGWLGSYALLFMLDGLWQWLSAF